MVLPGIVTASHNLIRTVMACAAGDAHCQPRQLSFTGAWQALRAFAERLQDARGEMVEALCVALLRVVSSHRFGDRPDRVEPRKRKRRPKHYPLVTQPRAQAALTKKG